MSRKLFIFALSICFIFIFSSLTLAATTVNLGVDFGGSTNTLFYEGNHEWYNVDTSISVGAEHLFSYKTLIEYGIGFEYQFPHRIKNFGVGEATLNFIPVYTIVNYYFDDRTKSELTPVAMMRLGYNWYEGNDAYKTGATLDGGYYFAFGLGVNFQKLLYGNGSLMFLYSVNNGKATIYKAELGHDVNFDITYCKFNLILSNRF